MVATVPGPPGLHARHPATVARSSAPEVITVVSPMMFRPLSVAQPEVTHCGPPGHRAQAATMLENHQSWLRDRVDTVVQQSRKSKRRPVQQLAVPTGLSGVDGAPVQPLVEVVSASEFVHVSALPSSVTHYLVIGKKLKLVMVASELTLHRLGLLARLRAAPEFRRDRFQTLVLMRFALKARRVLHRQDTMDIGLHGQHVQLLAEAVCSNDVVIIAVAKLPMFRSVSINNFQNDIVF